MLLLVEEWDFTCSHRMLWWMRKVSPELEWDALWRTESRGFDRESYKSNTSESMASQLSEQKRLISISILAPLLSRNTSVGELTASWGGQTGPPLTCWRKPSTRARPTGRALPFFIPPKEVRTRSDISAASSRRSLLGLEQEGHWWENRGSWDQFKMVAG